MFCVIQYNKVKYLFGGVVMKDFDFIDALSIGDNLSKNIVGPNEIFDLSLPLAIMDTFQEETKGKILQLQKQFKNAKNEDKKRKILNNINKLLNNLK
jgi:hypothetical protein